jgi:heme-degrading monooxygenase HmoA
VAYAVSIQRVRFRTPHDYELFKVHLAQTPAYLKKIPGFLHWTWWVHPEDPLQFIETHFWESEDAMMAWYKDGFHKYLREWGVKGSIVEDIVTNGVLDDAKLLRVCPLCGEASATPYDLKDEQELIKAPCGNCGFAFDVLPESPAGFTIYGAITATPAPNGSVAPATESV